jgi:Peptidase family M1 domain
MTFVGNDEPARSAALATLHGQQPSPASTPVQGTSALTASPQRIANYSIDATLDPADRTITGHQVLTWYNATNAATSTLRFHLYYNAWRNSESTWLRERRLGGGFDLATVAPDDWGRIDVTRMLIARAGEPPTDARRRWFIAPDDGNRSDRTVLEVALDRPAAPGDTLTVTLDWSSRVPRTFARTGVVGNSYFLAHWFPKIGVLQDSGWNCHQFHAATEFFSDFGTYDVRLTVPRGWIVGATGTERERRDQDNGTTVHRYYQENVHDFAWTTSPDYLELTDSFTHPALPPVKLRLLLQPEHRSQAPRHFDATRAALKYYGEWFGPYPYGHLTIVDPAWQTGFGGMEYPTIFTAGTRWIAPQRATDPEDVTIHEAGHQFWYGIVANNEFEHAWLDEGINTFATSRVMAQAFDPNYEVKRFFGGFVPWVFRSLPLSRDTETVTLAGYRAAGPGDTPSLPTWQYWPVSHWATTYDKTALWLHTLERMLGWETLQRILHTFFTRWAYRHPSPHDFFAVVNEVSGKDLTWFFDQVYRSSNVFDYGIDRFESVRVTVRGYLPDDAAGSAPASASHDAYRTTVVVRRYGDATFPVDVKLTLDGGEEVRLQWDGRDRWKAFDVERPVRARRVDVDPDRILLLDVNTTNNSALIDPAGPRAARKWALVWLIWLQDHLLTYGLFV